eukprot:PITA_21033
MGWKIHQMDVNTAFLNGFIQEQVYIEQPQGFEVHGKESHVCRLKKALYGLKQASRAWRRGISSWDKGSTLWKKLHASDLELVDPTLYRTLIGCFMYLVNTRPDICFAVNTMSQFTCEPGRVHWVVAKHILRYLQGTVDFGLDYRQGDGVRLAGYTDSDWKSTSSCCFGLGSAVVSWISRKQQSIALSSAETEYMAASLASCEAIWLCKMLFGLFG